MPSVPARAPVRRVPRVLLALLIAIALVALGGCRVDAGDIAVGSPGEGSVEGYDVSNGALPALGPIPGLSHWHGAYVMRICDDVLAPFESSDDPAGIHSHGDGVMHVHPFFEASGYESATIGLFADAMGFRLATGELTLPGGGTWRDGDLCGDTPGRVYVDRWSSDAPDAQAERIFSNPQDLRYEADGEMYQIAFAPVDAPPVIPPSRELLSQLRPAPTQPPEPWVDVDPQAPNSTVRLWPVDDVTELPCTPDQVPERIRVGTPACYSVGEPVFGSDAVAMARAVLSNREPALEVRTSNEFDGFVRQHFGEIGSEPEPLVLAIEVDGTVVTVFQVPQRPVSQNRLVISGGFTAQTASALAQVLNG